MIYHYYRISCRVIRRLAAAIDPSAERFAVEMTKIVLELCFLGHRPSGADAAVSRRDGWTNLAAWSSFKPVRTSRFNRGRRRAVSRRASRVFQIVAGRGSAAPSALLIFKR